MNLSKLKLPSCFTDVVPPELADALLMALVDEVDAYVAERVILAVRAILIANFGPAHGLAIFADLYGAADVSNSELVGGTVSRAAVSKACCRIRRGLGLPLRNPNNARVGRTAI